MTLLKGKSRIELYILENDLVKEKLTINVMSEEMLREVVNWIPQRFRKRSIIYVFINSRKGVLLNDFLERFNSLVHLDS